MTTYEVSYDQREYAKDQLGTATAPGGSLKNVMNFYDTWAPKYEAHITDMGDNIGKTTLEQISLIHPDPELRRDIKVLDCGAGTGYIGEQLAKLGFKDIDAVDGCESMLVEAKKKGVYKKLIKDFLGPNRLPIEDNTYDFLVAVGLFCPGHVTETCFPEMIRVVKPGGKIYISTRHINITGDPHMSVHLEPAMKSHEDNGNWKWLKREIVPGYLGDWDGFVVVFEVL